MSAVSALDVETLANFAARSDRAPRLSIAIPFYRDDPRRLLADLSAAAGHKGALEIVLYDDGCPDPALNRAVANALAVLDISGRLLTAAVNRGRAVARNRLAEAARGEWVLFLDADMRVGPDFLKGLDATMDEERYDAVFGGYQPLPDQADDPLHDALTRASDVHSLVQRQALGIRAFATCNLLVRRTVMAEIPFDDGYVGWGWEDVDWAASAARRFRLGHIDNPARHGGLQDCATLLDKFRAAAPNQARLLQKHPDLASMPSARAALWMRRLPGQAALRRLWASAALSRRAPLRLRVLGLKLWRASWAAEALRP